MVRTRCARRRNSNTNAGNCLQNKSRAEIEGIRGVDISGVMSSLLERGFIKIVGKKEVPGRPFLYGTTEKFLEHFGLKSLADLPQIGEIKGMIERAVRKEEIIGESRESLVMSDEKDAKADNLTTQDSPPTTDYQASHES